MSPETTQSNIGTEDLFKVNDALKTGQNSHINSQSFSTNQNVAKHDQENGGNIKAHAEEMELCE